MKVTDTDRQRNHARSRVRSVGLYWVMGLAIGIVGGAVVAWGLTTPPTVLESHDPHS